MSHKYTGQSTTDAGDAGTCIIQLNCSILNLSLAAAYECCASVTCNNLPTNQTVSACILLIALIAEAAFRLLAWHSPHMKGSVCLQNSYACVAVKKHFALSVHLRSRLLVYKLYTNCRQSAALRGPHVAARQHGNTTAFDLSIPASRRGVAFCGRSKRTLGDYTFANRV